MLTKCINNIYMCIIVYRNTDDVYHVACYTMIIVGNKITSRHDALYNESKVILLFGALCYQYSFRISQQDTR